MMSGLINITNNYVAYDKKYLLCSNKCILKVAAYLYFDGLSVFRWLIGLKMAYRFIDSLSVFRWLICL